MTIDLAGVVVPDAQLPLFHSYTVEVTEIVTVTRTYEVRVPLTQNLDDVINLIKQQNHNALSGRRTQLLRAETTYSRQFQPTLFAVTSY